MKKMIKLISVVLALVCACALLVGCGETEGDNTTSGTQTYTFGAELTYLDDVQGAAFSGSATGKGMIVIDNNSALKSLTGYYIDYLYVENTAITFKITSDSDVTDAKLWLSLTGCGPSGDYTYSSDGYADETDEGYTDGDAVNYTVELNGEALDYAPISMYELGAAGPTTNFNQYVIGANLTLKKGENVIKLITSNSILLSGTAGATAPIVDAIQIQTTASLTMEEYTSNIPESE